MQRNQWPLRYSAEDVRAAAIRQEAHYRAEAEEQRYQAMLGDGEACGECGSPRDALGRQRRTDPSRQAALADKKADEYAKWAQALATRGNDTLALHFDDAEYFGLLVVDSELGKTGDARRPRAVARVTKRLRPSGVAEERR